MATKHSKTPAAIKAQIAALQAALARAEAAEKARARDELIALVERAKCMPEVLAFAREKVSERKAANERAH